MLIHKKYEYPAIAELPKQFDIPLIKSYLADNMHRWQNNYNAHEGLCTNNGMVADTSLNFIEHFHLTGTDVVVGNAPKTSEADTFTVKDKIKKTNIHPYMNEYNWSTPLPHYEGTAIQEHLEGMFDAPIVRLRMSRMKPGGEVKPHIDYNTTYAVRFIIPLSGNAGVTNRFWYKGDECDFEMEEGKAYFLNVGYKHAVYHNGDEMRYYLLGTLGGQQDIECIRNNL
tara:strand:- start:72209 stop:72886 length:678 start_codon:yes stop_codon:yes gene_type:complete